MPNQARELTHSDRRRFLQILGAGATLALPGWVMGQNALWIPEDLPLTPTQIEGPFYPETTIEKQLYSDTDLRRKLGDHELAKGQSVVVEGIVKDRKGKPLNNSVVEVWQACASGRYNHSRDARNPGLLDNNFQFWGRTMTDSDGKYAFATIIPGKYPGRTARHIHFRVDSDGFRRLTTQCYFSDFGEDNMRDGLYLDLNREERRLVTVELDKPTAEKETDDSTKKQKSNEKKIDKPWVGQFDVVMAQKS